MVTVGRIQESDGTFAGQGGAFAGQDATFTGSKIEENGIRWDVYRNMGRLRELVHLRE